MVGHPRLGDSCLGGEGEEDWTLHQLRGLAGGRLVLVGSVHRGTALAIALARVLLKPGLAPTIN